MRQLMIIAALALGTVGAQAAEYSCKVYCKGPDGNTWVTVRADSASDAAKIVDKQGDQVCRSAGHDRATSSTMSASQCERK